MQNLRKGMVHSAILIGVVCINLFYLEFIMILFQNTRIYCFLLFNYICTYIFIDLKFEIT